MTSMSLPSIHEMFPDHLMKPSRPNSGSPDYRSPPRSPIPSVCERLNRFHIKPPFGVDGRRNQGHSPHPQEAAYRTRRLSSSDSSHPHLSNRSYPCNTNGGNNLEPDFEDDDCPVGRSMPSIDGALLGSNLDALGRKHVCPTCFKRFNRPSSLRIHLNTHTGATPFKCPWPKCGREFNVNSNMRRHYRNHLGAPRGQGHFPPTHGTNELRPIAPATTHSIPPHHAYSEGSHLTNDHSQSRIRQRRVEEEGQYSRMHAASSHGSVSPSPSASSTSSRTSSPAGTERHSSEHSSKPKYNASKPYSASFSDARVRTTLRPVFM